MVSFRRTRSWVLAAGGMDPEEKERKKKHKKPGESPPPEGRTECCSRKQMVHLKRGLKGL